MTFALHDAIAELATYNDDPAAGGITREVFTPTYERSVEFVSGLMRDAGLEVRRDAFGNLYGRLEGTDPSLPAVRTGSHVDTTLNAGRYDGVVGVLGAIEAVGSLRDRTLRRAVEVVAFAGEEPRFASGCIGSRAVMGELSRADLDRLVDRDGVSLAQALAGAGFEPDAIETALWIPPPCTRSSSCTSSRASSWSPPGSRSASSRRSPRPTICGSRCREPRTTPVRRRWPCAATRWWEQQRRWWSWRSSRSARPRERRSAPSASCACAPARSTSCPARSSSTSTCATATSRRARRSWTGSLAVVGVMATKRGLTAVVDEIVRDEPGTCAPFIVEAADAACASLGVRPRHMISGAYHDALILSRKIPVGMLFVPTRRDQPPPPTSTRAARHRPRRRRVGEVLAALAT